MNKEQMVEAVKSIPLFRLRDVAVKDEEVIDGQIIEGTSKERWINAENDKAVTEKDSFTPLCFVSKRYKIVQFHELMLPIIEPISEFEGRLTYFNGFAIMDIFPQDENYNIDGNKIGIVAYNSVDKTCALNIRFCVGYGTKILSLPAKVTGWKKIHTGDVTQKTQDYISVLGKVKSAWSDIVKKFSQFEVTLTEIDGIAKEFELDNKLTDKLKKELMGGVKYNLWDMCVKCIDTFSNKVYKSEVHKRKKIDDFVERIFEYRVALSIGI